MIYLDNNATTRVDPRVVQAMLPFFTESFGNPSSRHDVGRAAAVAVRTARRQVQVLLGAAFETEVVFTSGGTEADATAILAAVRAHPERREVVISAVEHAAVLAVCRDLEVEGYRIHEIPVAASGQLDIAAYRAVISPQVAVASVMWANNETGVVFPVAELAEIAHAAGVAFHTDAVQAAGKMALNVKSTCVDMLSISGHKLHAPKGIGAMYLRQGTRFRPLLRGGHQEKGRRAGTENVPAIVALGAAAEIARQIEDVAALRDALQAEVLARVPDCRVLAADAPRLSNTLAMVFGGIAGEAMVAHLGRAGVAASGGSACNAGRMAASHVPLAMGLSPAEAQGMIRFSLSRETTAEEITRAAEIVADVAAGLRAPVAPRRRGGAHV